MEEIIKRSKKDSNKEERAGEKQIIHGKRSDKKERRRRRSGVQCHVKEKQKERRQELKGRCRKIKRK